MKNSNKDIVDLIWHWKIEDNLSWEFCSGILKQNHNIVMSSSQVKNKFLNYFIKSANVVLYSKCLKCSMGELLPRKSVYGYFVSCSCFPTCNYKAGCNRSLD